MAFLSGLGLTTDEESVFVALLELQRARLAELEAVTGDGDVATLLDRLAELGLVSRSADRDPTYLPLPVEQAVDLLARRRIEEVERARQQAAGHVASFRARRGEGTGDYVELVRGRDAIAQRFLLAEAGAVEEVVVFDKPPYVTPHQLNVPELGMLDRGVSCRVVYDSASLALPGQLAWVEALASRGEKSRVSAAVPLKLFIVDGAQAIIPLGLTDERVADEALVLARPSSLLAALRTLFELVWDRSRPLSGPLSASDVDPFERRLVALLGAGLKDQSIGTQLGVSLRTVERRIADLMERLGCATRYQLGVATQARGWHD